MGFEMYMTFGDKAAKSGDKGDKSPVVGESLDVAHIAWTECQGFETGHAQKTTEQGAHAGGRANFNPFIVKKELDAGSPMIAQHCAAATVFGCVTIHLCRASGGGIKDKAKKPFMSFELHSCIISEVSTAGEGGGDSIIPAESVSFSYSKIKWSYVPSGDVVAVVGKAPREASWDVRANMAI